MVALETSGAAGSVAAMQSDRLLVEHPLTGELRTAQSLAPAIRDVLRTASWRPTDVELVAVARGPGSFTGLRLGVTTAKVFAYAAGAEILGVDTLEVIASQATSEFAPLCAAIHAQRSQVFSARFQRDTDGSLMRRSESEIVDIDKWLAEMLPGMAVTGPALSRLAERLPGHARAVEGKLWQPTAVAVGRLAIQQFRSGRRDDVWKLSPRYLRRSTAEEKRDRQDAAQRTPGGPP